jgi:hypothetical protein
MIGVFSVPCFSLKSFEGVPKNVHAFSSRTHTCHTAEIVVLQLLPFAIPFKLELAGLAAST